MTASALLGAVRLFACRLLKRLAPIVLGVTFGVGLTGCHSVRETQSPSGPNFRILTYNVNWGAPQPDLAAEVIKRADAQIVCLQETTPEWEGFFRASLATEYPFMEFRESKGRMGGGQGFLSKVPAAEIAYVPSDTGWFDGWVRTFQTDAGRVQVLNVHLQPPVGKSGAWTVSGYLSTGDDRKKELQRFCAAMIPDLPTIVAGDFNDTERSAPLAWLTRQNFRNALPEFDRSSPTWEWRVGLIHLRRRMDHILYSGGLRCCEAAVMRAGASDHFPVLATFERSLPITNSNASAGSRESP